MKGLGMILWIGGIALAGYAFFVFDTSVEIGRYGISRVVNADLQQRQMMMLVAGCALFIVGVVMHAIGVTKAAAGPSVSVWQAYKDEVQRLGNAKPTEEQRARMKRYGMRHFADGVSYDGQVFATPEDALAAAEEREKRTDVALGR